jgi:hypothetical protein
MVTNILQQGLATCSPHYQHVQMADALYQLRNYYSYNNEHKKIKNKKNKQYIIVVHNQLSFTGAVNTCSLVVQVTEFVLAITEELALLRWSRG